MAAYGMVASMSGKGDCYDNAVAESFFATLEFELMMQNDWQTRRRPGARSSATSRPGTIDGGAIRRWGTSVPWSTKCSCRRPRSSYHSRVHRIGASPTCPSGCRRRGSPGQVAEVQSNWSCDQIGYFAVPVETALLLVMMISTDTLLHCASRRSKPCGTRAPVPYRFPSLPTLEDDNGEFARRSCS